MKLKNKFLSISIGIISGLIIFDFGLKIIENTPLWRVFPVIEAIFGQPDLKNGYSFTPNAKGIWTKENRTLVSINELGLRDLQYEYENINGFKIFLSGDSIVEALQVNQENNFDNITENNFRKKDLNINILNLAKSGDGPLRQLINVEYFSQSLRPDLIILFSGLGEFFSGELLDDSIAPGYIRKANNKFERGYAFRERWQVKFSNNKSFLFILDKLQKYPSLRMLYYRMKEDIRTLIWKKENKNFGYNHNQSKCKKKEIDKYMNLIENESNDIERLIFNHFLQDFSNSEKLENIPKLYVIDTIPIPKKECNVQIKKRKILISKLAKLFKDHDIKFIDFNNEIFNLVGFDNNQLRFYGGHLNYYGHKVYSTALTNVIQEYFDEYNLTNSLDLK